MKTINKINYVVAFVMITATLMFIPSCKKEVSGSQSNSIKSPDLLAALRTKTGGGKIALSINSSLDKEENMGERSSIGYGPNSVFYRESPSVTVRKIIKNSRKFKSIYISPVFKKRVA